MKTKLIWKVKPAPTGRFKSFERRGWPSAFYPGPDERAAAHIVCDDAYIPRNVKEGKHAELKVLVADWGAGSPETGSFVWRALKQRCKTLEEAKQLARMAIEAHPGFRPPNSV